MNRLADPGSRVILIDCRRAPAVQGTYGRCAYAEPHPLMSYITAGASDGLPSAEWCVLEL